MNRLVDVLLPDHIQDLSVPNDKAEIKEKLVREAKHEALQKALLPGVNISSLIDFTDLDNKAKMLYHVREHFREIQEKQVELVISFRI